MEYGLSFAKNLTRVSAFSSKNADIPSDVSFLHFEISIFRSLREK